MGRVLHVVRCTSSIWRVSTKLRTRQAKMLITLTRLTSGLVNLNTVDQRKQYLYNERVVGAMDSDGRGRRSSALHVARYQCSIGRFML